MEHQDGRSVEAVSARRRLIGQVSQLGTVDASALEGMRLEVLALEREWTRVYSDYHTGGWLTLSLLNSTSEATDTTIRDCVPTETELLSAMPHTRAFLRGLDLNYMWVRLAKLEPGTIFWEHRDYQELDDVERLRLHVPVVTNAGASLIIEGTKVHLTAGHIWKLNPRHRHGASNLGADARVHILMDCYGSETLGRMLESETLDERSVTELPGAPEEELAAIVADATRAAAGGDYDGAEYSLLKLFHIYHLEEGAGYDLIARMYDSLGQPQRAEEWRGRRAKFLGTADDARPIL